MDEYLCIFRVKCWQNRTVAHLCVVSLRRIDQLALPPLLFITLPITLPLWLHPTVGPTGAIRTFPFNGAFPVRSFSGFLHFSALFAAFHL